MYHEVGLAVRYVHGRNTAVKPTDYLKFFCLGKTLTKAEKIRYGAEGDMRWRLQIYVHAKLTMVDDKFVLVSTSHVDDRSLMGNRDTEIGMLSYHQDKNGAVIFSKEIQEFRMALLSEHLGGYDEDCIDMASTKCLEKLTNRSEKAQWLYMNDPEEDLEDEDEDRKIHLIPFPINVTQEGEVGPEEGWDDIPDSNASMKGEASWGMKWANRLLHVSQRGKQESSKHNRQSSLNVLLSKCTRALPGKIFAVLILSNVIIH